MYLVLSGSNQSNWVGQHPKASASSATRYAIYAADQLSTRTFTNFDFTKRRAEAGYIGRDFPEWLDFQTARYVGPDFSFIYQLDDFLQTRGDTDYEIHDLKLALGASYNTRMDPLQPDWWLGHCELQSEYFNRVERWIRDIQEDLPGYEIVLTWHQNGEEADVTNPDDIGLGGNSNEWRLIYQPCYYAKYFKRLQDYFESRIGVRPFTILYNLTHNQTLGSPPNTSAKEYFLIQEGENGMATEPNVHFCHSQLANPNVADYPANLKAEDDVGGDANITITLPSTYTVDGTHKLCKVQYIEGEWAFDTMNALY